MRAMGRVGIRMIEDGEMIVGAITVVVVAASVIDAQISRPHSIRSRRARTSVRSMRTSSRSRMSSSIKSFPS